MLRRLTPAVAPRFAGASSATSTVVAAATTAAPITTAARRNYIDYANRKYPIVVQFYYGLPIVTFIAWLFWISCGSVWWESNRQWKSDTLRGWKRQLGYGYKWSDEWGPQVDTIYTNLPDRAE